ncbi:MAG: response regulator transcription factor [Anaerolineaceae bacterium]|nr:response regulator transcription factor [Anaerolineaceae bacterium]
MNNQQILIVEDEHSIGEVVSLYLRRAGYDVTYMDNGEEALTFLKTKKPDLVVLDLMLPKVDGWEITRWLREHGDIPIIMVTARREETDSIAGLEMGADDYVTKPFSPQELVSRVRAVLRRAQPAGQVQEEAEITLGELHINQNQRLLTIAEKEIPLSVKEFELLWFLMSNPRQVFSRDQLLENIWGLSQYIDPGTVTVHIRRIREKIEEDSSNPRHIQTVWGVGYKFEP